MENMNDEDFIKNCDLVAKFIRVRKFTQMVDFGLPNFYGKSHPRKKFSHFENFILSQKKPETYHYRLRSY